MRSAAAASLRSALPRRTVRVSRVVCCARRQKRRRSRSSHAEPLREGVDWPLHARDEPVDVQAVPPDAYEDEDGGEVWGGLSRERAQHGGDLPARPASAGERMLPSIAHGGQVQRHHDAYAWWHEGGGGLRTEGHCRVPQCVPERRRVMLALVTAHDTPSTVDTMDNVDCPSCPRSTGARPSTVDVDGGGVRGGVSTSMIGVHAHQGQDVGG